MFLAGYLTWAQERPRFKPLPPGVIELTGIGGTDGGIVELKDGSIVLAQGSEMAESGRKTLYIESQRTGQDLE